MVVAALSPSTSALPVVVLMFLLLPEVVEQLSTILSTAATIGSFPHLMEPGPPFPSSTEPSSAAMHPHPRILPAPCPYHICASCRPPPPSRRQQQHVLILGSSPLSAPIQSTHPITLRWRLPLLTAVTSVLPVALALFLPAPGLRRICTMSLMRRPTGLLTLVLSIQKPTMTTFLMGPWHRLKLGGE